MEMKSNFGDQQQRFARAFAHRCAGAFPGCSLAVMHRGEAVASTGLGRFTYEPQSPEVAAGHHLRSRLRLQGIATTTAGAAIAGDERRRSRSTTGVVNLSIPASAVTNNHAATT